MKSKKKSANEAIASLTSLCSRSEQCSGDIIQKCRKWGLSEEECAETVEYLRKERYVDDERFCRAFVNDKVRFSKWGRRKVEQALAMKGISESMRREALDRVDEREYISALRPLIQAKRKSVKAANDYELNGKLIRFAMQRGFTMDIIRHCIDKADEHDVEEDF